MTRWSLIAIVAFFVCSPAAQAQNLFESPGEPVVIGSGFDVPSAALGAARRVNVMLPPGYNEPDQQTRRYPVLYLLDGGVEGQDFLHIAGLIHQGSLWGGNAPMILVGVESDDRLHEFTTPSADPKERSDYPTSGGADQLRRFLVDELRPLIDAAYRTDGVDGLIGESLAGYFVLDVALQHGGDFQRYIAVSPSLWWSDEALSLQADALLSQPQDRPWSLWMAGGDEGGEMQSGINRIVSALTAHPSPNRTWLYKPFPDETHATIFHPAATRAIRSMFPGRTQ